MQHTMMNIQLRRCQKQIKPTSLNEFEDGYKHEKYNRTFEKITLVAFGFPGKFFFCDKTESLKD